MSIKKRHQILLLYAYDVAFMYPKHMYEERINEKLNTEISDYNIYMIGKVPKVYKDKPFELFGRIFFKLTILEEKHLISIDNSVLNIRDKFLLEKSINEKILEELVKTPNFDFEIFYIGQSYGNKTKRNALNRLHSHEKLQEILIKESSDERYETCIILMGIQQSKDICVIMDKADNGENISGIDYIQKTKKKDLISIYEAGLIKHFEPKYNKDFKNNFPSKKLKILNNIYKHKVDFLSLEIISDIIPKLFSHKVEKEREHGIVFNMNNNTQISNNEVMEYIRLKEKGE